MSGDSERENGMYADEVDYDEEDDIIEEDLLMEEVDEDDGIDGEIADEEIEADDEEPAGGGANDAGQGKTQMLYIPGIGYVPLSGLGGIPGLNLGGQRRAEAPDPEGEREWKGLATMPAVTQDTIKDLTQALHEDEKDDLTIMLLGKGGVGKSSTLNSLLNEQAATVLPFNAGNARTTVYTRRAPSGFLLNIIDTPSILDQDAVSEGKLENIAKSLKDREIDAVIYVDRLDEYAVGTVDRAMIAGITRFFGPSIWNNTVLCFTHGDESSAPPGVDFYDHVSSRENQLKDVIASYGGAASDMASALIENSSRCAKNADGEKIVAGDVPWVADVLEKIVEVALNVAPYEYSPEAAAKASNPNRRRKWLIPLIVAAQIGIKFLLDRVMEDDGCKGDENGPFDAQTVKERRQELKEEREEAKRRKNKQKARSNVVTSSASFADEDAFPEEEDFEDEDWE